MKLLLIAGVIGALVFGGIFLRSTSEVIKSPLVEEKLIEVDTLEKRINEALEAAQASTTAKAQEAYDAVVKAEEQRVADEVKAAYIAEIEATIIDPAY